MGAKNSPSRHHPLHPNLPHPLPAGPLPPPPNPKPPRHHRPRPPPRKRAPITHIKRLPIHPPPLQNQPLPKNRIQPPRTLRLLPIPRPPTPWKPQRLPQIRLHGGVHRDADEVVERAVGDGADDVRRAEDGGVAGGVSEGGVGGQGVFLGVVEVCQGGVGDARVGFEGGDVTGAEVEGVVFCAGLEEDVARGEGGEGEGGEEVGEEGCWGALVWMVRWREGGAYC